VRTEIKPVHFRIEEIDMSENERRHPWAVLGLIMAALPIAACQEARAGSADDPAAQVKSATVEKIKGTEISRVILSAKAAERLDIKTAEVREEQQGRSGKPALSKVIPYGAVLYDATGAAWVYTNPEPLVYVRHRITIDYIVGGVAILTDGPAAGVKVVTVGASLLYGTELEVGES
jgi:hypothetical protein